MNEYQADGYWVECAGQPIFFTYQGPDYDDYDCYEDQVTIENNFEINDYDCWEEF